MNKPTAKPGIPCPPEVLTLVERYDRNRDDYRSGRYNEARLRQEFLNPLFEALGWDMANRADFAEAYKEVIHEDAIKIGKETKAPDYCFRIGGTRKFFLEAKKPSVFRKEDIPAAFQLRRYAWSAKLPLSILCDFEEFAVYDTRIKPDRNDKASTARISYFTYKDYAGKWGEIVSVFSKDAVLKGSFDKYAETTRLKKGTATVDDAFLTEIEDWRDLLARNIAIRNPDLSQRELNFSVQRTIDRIVFLRICEDRGIEEYGRLQALQNGTNAYKRLVQLFSQADDRYNSGLFHFQKEKDRHEEPDTLTTKIEIDDKPLKDILKRLYYPDSPYEFSVLSADILGQVYEQFLGKVIRLTAGHQAKVEEKPEVRKAGGVYYTPKYIVDYIVKNTVGRLLVGGDRGSEGTNANSDVQGFGSVAGSDESDNRGLSLDESISKGRALRVDQSNTEGSSLNPGQYRGGTQSEIEKGISSSRIDSPGFSGGVGNASADSQQAGVPAETGLGQSVGNNPASWTIGQRSASLTPTPEPRQLTPKQASRLKILDPACGSGSFLLGAYQYLLDWHQEWYVKDDPKKWATSKNPTLYQAQGGDYRLTTSERKRILLNNIYGVDIDTQAVEVTKLSLLLKVLEGENSQTLANQLRMFHQRALPDLGDNIKCGNSLIANDYENQLTIQLDKEEIIRINAFNWDQEFSEIMRSGGFDAVIGNPPYGAEFSESTNAYMNNRFATFVLRGESYLVFIEKAIILLKKGGQFGYIVPDTYLNLGFTQPLRDYLLHNTRLKEVVSLPSKVFSGATVDTTLLFAEKAERAPTYHKYDVLVRSFNKKKVISSVSQSDRMFSVSTEAWYKQKAFNVSSDNSEALLINKIESRNNTIEKIADMFSGIKVYEVGKGNPPQTAHVRDAKPYTSERKENKSFQPFFDGKHIGRYTLMWDQNNWVKYGPWLAAPRNPENFEDGKILIRKIVGETLIATHIPETSYCNTLLHVLKIKPNANLQYQFLLGVLNSKFIGWYFRKKFQISADDTFPQIMIRDIMQFPLPDVYTIHHDKIVSLVDQMLSLNKQLPTAKTDHEKTALQRQFDAADHQIDQLVYELYGLTEEEIKIVTA
jgi:type I restriction-modification system DNA methylase subunit